MSSSLSIAFKEQGRALRIQWFGRNVFRRRVTADGEDLLFVEYGKAAFAFAQTGSWRWIHGPFERLLEPQTLRTDFRDAHKERARLLNNDTLLFPLICPRE